MNESHGSLLRSAARELHDAGLCVLPVKVNDGVVSGVRGWTLYKSVRSTPEQHDAWFTGTRHTGIGVVHGKVSGNLETIEFKGHAVRDGLLDEVTDILTGAGFGREWRTILSGWVTESPCGDRCFRVRVVGASVPRSTKLARRLAREVEYTQQEHRRLAKRPRAEIVRVRIETRGEGDFGAVEPSYLGVRTSGRTYRRYAGSPATIPVLAADTMAVIRDVCRMIDSLPKSTKARTAPYLRRPLTEGQAGPTDNFDDRVPWKDIIGVIFEPVLSRGHRTYWREKGRGKGVSAVTEETDKGNRVRVLSTSTPFSPETSYGKFSAYAQVHHGGDHRKALRALVGQGYGSDPAAPYPAAGSAGIVRDETPSAGIATALPNDLPSRSHAAARRTRDRSRMDMTNEAEAMEQLLAAMADGRLPGLYRRSGGLCRVSENGQDGPLIRQLDPDNLRAYFNDHVTTFITTNDPITRTPKRVRTLVTRKTCATVLGREDWPVPPLRGVVTSPVVRPDDSVLAKPGYDPATGLYLHPHVPLRRLGPALTRGSVDRARKVVLDTMLAGFPWVEASDRAQYVGALLAPILRPRLPGPTPLVVITTMGSDSVATLLKDVFKYLYGLSEAVWPKDEAELRKVLTTQLRGTCEPVVCFDGFPQGCVISSPVLSSLLMRETWRDRLLGSNEIVTIPNDRLWIVNGNDLRTSSDNSGQTLRIRIDPARSHPAARGGFEAGDLRPWLTKNASAVVAALVTMVRGWLAAGAPTFQARTGDHSSWGGAVAGLLGHLGITGWPAESGEGAIGPVGETDT
ncbi:hypothetical protein [Streptomyces sp. NPDC003077]|uniref:hypothetical protein n=1 Tax=Streptomyces sp. NPDC003077 TaxID=3154443 RepID=UPI0033A6795F